MNAEDPQGLVSLRSGINIVETSQEKLNGGCKEEENTGTECSLNFKEHVRAVETRSQRKHGMELKGETSGGKPERDTGTSAVLPSKVILNSYTDEDLATKQKEDPDISFVYENLLKGRKRPSSSDAVTKSPAARHYWIIWNSLNKDNGLVVKECLQKNGLSKNNQLLIPRSLRKEVLEEIHDARMGGHFGCRKTYEKVKQKLVRDER